MKRQPIGIFDSGIGGLSVLQALRAELPAEDFIYIADSGHAPYGERDEAHVRARSRAIVSYLVGQNVKALVIACNTATAAAIHLLRAEHPDLPLVGVEPALKPAVHLSKTGCIGVLATRRTLTSAKFQALLESQAGLARFVVQPCDGLADAIERSAETGDMSKTIALCARYTGAMGRFGTSEGNMDTLVLGCTHYPFAGEALRELLGDGVALVDNGEAIARQTRRLAHLVHGQPPAQAGARPPEPAHEAAGQVSLFTTGQFEALEAASRRWLGLAIAVQPLHF